MTIKEIERISGLLPLDKAYVIPRDAIVHEVESTRLMGNLPDYTPEYNKRLEKELREQAEDNVLDVRV
ncbi:hypothetical protein J4466_05175 [Candidatus Pacearchaeota archaeon]|nr:hypothetical protein [Candidatus Pacearchaeota archaeon]